MRIRWLDHARLNSAGREVSIEDLASKNGTWVDGERIQRAVLLADGKSFRLGSETVRFELTIRAADKRPPLPDLIA
jgi:pSer/pThr/pTyr-binding forkhead associated (FHA) protein